MYELIDANTRKRRRAARTGWWKGGLKNGGSGVGTKEVGEGGD